MQQALLHGFTQLSRSVCRFGNEGNAARLAVQTIHQRHLPAASKLVGQQFSHTVPQGGFIFITRGVGEQRRCLVNRQHRLVLVKNGKLGLHGYGHIVTHENIAGSISTHSPGAKFRASKRKEPMAMRDSVTTGAPTAASIRRTW